MCGINCWNILDRKLKRRGSEGIIYISAPWESREWPHSRETLGLKWFHLEIWLDVNHPCSELEESLFFFCWEICTWNLWNKKNAEFVFFRRSDWNFRRRKKGKAIRGFSLTEGKLMLTLVVSVFFFFQMFCVISLLITMPMVSNSDQFQMEEAVVWHDTMVFPFTNTFLWKILGQKASQLYSAERVFLCVLITFP